MHMILSDNHVHTFFSADSEASIESHLLKAKEKHFTSICFTDHMDYEVFLPENNIEFTFLPDDYFATLRNLQKQYNDLEIRIGVELGLKDSIFSKALSLTKEYPFDFVIGSTHMIDDYDPYYMDYWENFGEKEGIRHYYETTCENVLRGYDFDVYGHIDYVIRYAPTLKKAKKEGKDLEPLIEQFMTDNMECIEQILKELIKCGYGIEANSGGYLAGLSHPNPHEKILALYHDLGGEILTIGSDAHDAINLGNAFDKLPALLQQCGFSHYTIFKDRSPVFLPLS